MPNLAIETVKEFADSNDLVQIIVVALDKDNTAHVVTYGKTIKDCRLAAVSGNNLKRHMCWPDELCHETPARLLKKGIQL